MTQMENIDYDYASLKIIGFNTALKTKLIIITIANKKTVILYNKFGFVS